MRKMYIATSPAEYVEWFTKKMKRYGVLYRPGDHDPSQVLDIPELNMTDGCPSPQQYCQVYIDDIVLVACDIDEAVRQVKHLVQILKREKLFISLAKTVFATEWLRFLKLKLKIYLSFTHDSIYMFDDLTLLFTFE